MTDPSHEVQQQILERVKPCFLTITDCFFRQRTEMALTTNFHQKYNDTGSDFCVCSQSEATTIE